MSRRPPTPSPDVPAAEWIAQRKRLLPGRLRPMKDIGQEGFLRWRSEAVTLRQETKDPYKIAVIERFRLEEIQGKRFRPSGSQKGDVEYRIGYYTVARNGKWLFGQFALFIPAADLAPLLQLAREEGTLLKDLDIRA